MSRTIAMTRFAPASLRMISAPLGAVAPALTDRNRICRDMPRNLARSGAVGLPC